MESDKTSVQNLIQRANNHPERNGVLRRETLLRLISLVHSASLELKTLAAVNIPTLFTDFPDLEEQAINAVYDLCEDHSPQVRIDGYNAIAEISKADNKLVKRNADVLLQLLQSDEPEEVAVVKKALIQHIEMNASITLGVLCDQLSPIGSEVDEEERNMRKRLQSLVLYFILEDAKSTIHRHVTINSLAQTIFLNGLYMVIPHLDSTMLQRISNELILPLPTLHFPPKRGERLVTTLLDRTASDIKRDDPLHLQDFQAPLELAQQLVVRYRVSRPLMLFRYYCSTLAAKSFLHRLPRQERYWIINNLADLLSFCDQNFATDHNIQLCQWRTVDHVPHLLHIISPALADLKISSSCIALLRACLRRRNSQPFWTITPTLNNSLVETREHADKLLPHDDKRDIQKLIVFLTSKRPIGHNQSIGPGGSQASIPLHIKPRLVPATSLTLAPPRPPFQHTPSQPGPSKLVFNDAPSTAQKRKTASEPEGAPKLSLLNRLQVNSSEIYKPQGLSIKGAASMTSPDPVSRPIQPQELSAKPVSLLERLQGVDSPSSESSEARNRKRRKR